MNSEAFSDMLSAGAIIAGFGATFLAFRVQREAEFYRLPGHTQFDEQHFTTSFFLIIVGTGVAVLAGVVIPLLALQGLTPACVTPRVAASGLLGSIVLMVGYFFDELVHYRIILGDWRSGLDDDWQRETPILFGSLITAVSIMVFVNCWTPR